MDVEDNFRKTVGQALGGLAVLLGAGSAYLQFSQQQRASHDLLLSNQVSKGFEQLGSEKLVVRLGGIYALEGVMNTSDQYYQPVLEALSAFVRDGAKRPPASEEPPPTSTSVVRGRVMLVIKPPSDIQAALTAIGKRSAGQARVNLSDAFIAGANLNHADLSDADLGGANLSLANLLYANLIRADLLAADLHGATLANADLSLADLLNANLFQANLSGANLSGAQLGSANLSGANPERANLSGAGLALANLSGAMMFGANLSGANLIRANLTGAMLLAQKQLDGACGSGVVLPPGLP